MRIKIIFEKNWTDETHTKRFSHSPWACVYLFRIHQVCWPWLFWNHPDRSGLVVKQRSSTTRRTLPYWVWVCSRTSYASSLLHQAADGDCQLDVGWVYPSSWVFMGYRGYRKLWVFWRNDFHVARRIDCQKRIDAGGFGLVVDQRRLKTDK